MPPKLARIIAPSFAIALAAAAIAPPLLSAPLQPRPARVPLSCSHGPPGQAYRAHVRAPERVPRGEVFTVRVDGVSSGKIESFGLNYIHAMETNFVLSQQVAYVRGSLRLIPNTGTKNVANTARLDHRGGRVRLTLPAKVKNGSSYTPPSFELELRATAEDGARVGLWFHQQRVRANAFLVGEVQAVCKPDGRAAPLSATLITDTPPSRAAR